MAQVIATKLLRVSGIELAQALGKDESVASRVKSGERAVSVVEWLKVIDLLGYKLVSKDKQCVPADELSMLRRTYAHVHSLNDDLWDDPE